MPTTQPPTNRAVHPGSPEKQKVYVCMWHFSFDYGDREGPVAAGGKPGTQELVV